MARGLLSLSNRRKPEVSGRDFPISPDSREYLHEQIREALTTYEPQYYSTKAGIIQHYRDTYGERVGRGGWKDHLAKDLAARTGRPIGSIRRELQPDRINRASAGIDWRKFGKTLPPSAYIPKRRRLSANKRAMVSASVNFKISETYKAASFTRVLTPQLTQELMRQEDFTAALQSYGLPTGNISEFDIDNLDVSLV